ncbi:methyl-accepting chemotaxis [Micractinium conductrix]|uniref:Methyl-accepting chemotaxis n=1 Tax=Micractinium conductrix TaxID=554055 RepID=A0A2P6VHQ7_9CHLO|nr:methyl-accepting chemotaxis [Micractinium conductrix]|eukprot:PSC73597.1 methyl-accepting chemotaxis [Micractinium conductrix]
MLSKALGYPLLLSSGRQAAAAAALASSRLVPALTRDYAAQGDKEEGEDSYDRMKREASKSGDPSREWMQGTKEQAAGYARSATETAEQLYEATKRATQDVTMHAKEAAGRAGLKDVKGMVGGAKSGVEGVKGMAAAAGAATGLGDKIGDVGRKVADAAQHVVGDAHDLPSARAEFEKSRSAEVQGAENKDRKSQLTDEATTADNPKEQRTRDEHEILPNEFYTKH